MPLAVICTYSHVGSTLSRSVAAEVTPTATIDDSNSTIGIADSSLYGLSPADIDKTLTELQSIGVQNIRVFVPWSLIKIAGPTDLPGAVNWQMMDNVMNAARAHNMGVLAMVTSTPLWAGGATLPPGAGSPDPAVYADFVKQVATRYGDVISAYEVMNEVNSANFFQPVDPVKYTAILKAVWTTLKGTDGTGGVDPTAQVIAGALNAVQDIPGLSQSPQSFVAAMYAAGAKGFFDAISIHPYDFFQNLKFSDLGQYPMLSALYQVQQVRAIMVQNGDSQKLIWATEYGLTTSPDPSQNQAPTDQQKQADFISDFINAWRALTYTGPMFIYTTRDGVPGTDTGYGIFQADWTPKLAAQVIANAIHLPPVVTPIIEPIVALVQWIQQSFAQVQQAIAAFTSSLQTAFANAIKTFTDLLSGIFKPAAAQATTAASLAPAAATLSTADTLAAAKKSIDDLKTQVVESKNATAHVTAADTTESGATKVVDAAQPTAAGAVEPKATETTSTDTKATDTKSTDTKSTDTTSTDTKATDTKSTDTKAADPKTEDSTPPAKSTGTSIPAATPTAATPTAATPTAATPTAATPTAETPKAGTSQPDSSASQQPKTGTSVGTPKGADTAAGHSDTPASTTKDSGNTTKDKSDKKSGKTNKLAPAAASEPSKPAGRSESDAGGKSSPADNKAHQHEGS
jgi:polysaccharide biosynthesis protein PslG